MTIGPKTDKKPRRPKKNPRIPESMRDGVIRRDGGWCVIASPVCTLVATVADHVANRGSGGSVILNNPVVLVAACVPCNGWKEDATGDDLEWLKRRGLRVEKAATNEATLERCRNNIVTYSTGERYLLREDYKKEAVI